MLITQHLPPLLQGEKWGTEEGEPQRTAPYPWLAWHFFLRLQPLPLSSAPETAGHYSELTVQEDRDVEDRVHVTTTGYLWKQDAWGWWSFWALLGPFLTSTWYASYPLSRNSCSGHQDNLEASHASCLEHPNSLPHTQTILRPFILSSCSKSHLCSKVCPG